MNNKKFAEWCFDNEIRIDNIISIAGNAGCANTYNDGPLYDFIDETPDAGLEKMFRKPVCQYIENIEVNGREVYGGSERVELINQYFIENGIEGFIINFTVPVEYVKNDKTSMKLYSWKDCYSPHIYVEELNWDEVSKKIKGVIKNIKKKTKTSNKPPAPRKGKGITVGEFQKGVDEVRRMTQGGV